MEIELYDNMHDNDIKDSYVLKLMVLHLAAQLDISPKEEVIDENKENMVRY